jgi:hypothetical protein
MRRNKELIKVFAYEVKRYLLNKYYLILLVTVLLVSRYILTDSVIYGIANMAPFSPWSIGYYLAKVTPLMLLSILYFMTFLYSNAEKNVQKLMSAIPVNPLHYKLAKIAAMVMGYFLLCLCAILTGFLFYIQMFHFLPFHAYLQPMLLTLLPGLLFIIGVGLSIGRIHIHLLYPLMVLLLLYNFIPLSYKTDYIGSRFFEEFPKTLTYPDPMFKVPFSIISMRVVISLLGILLIIYHVFHKSSSTSRHD